LNSVALRHGFSLRNIKATASNSNKAAPTTPQLQDSGRAVGGAGSSIPTPVLDTVNVSFNVTSSYQQFIDLLRDLEANLRIMDVTHLGVGVGTAPGSYDFSVELKTYWLRQQ
jgi:hypothetical protein